MQLLSLDFVALLFLLTTHLMDL